MGGCMGQSNQSQRITINSLTDQLHRIKFVCQQQQIKLEHELKLQQDILIGQFGKETRYRSCATQKAMIGRTVYTSNIKSIYLILQNEAKRILDYKDLMDQWSTIESILPSINILTYSSLFLSNQTLTRFERSLKIKFPQYKQPSDSDIKQELIRYQLRNSQVTFEMENTFTLEFSNKYNIEMKRIDEAGHTYCYGAGTAQLSN